MSARAARSTNINPSAVRVVRAPDPDPDQVIPRSSWYTGAAGGAGGGGTVGDSGGEMRRVETMRSDGQKQEDGRT